MLCKNTEHGSDFHHTRGKSLPYVDKSQGLTLGAHPPLPLSDAGVHSATGLKLVRPGEHLRHLGMLLARPEDQAAAAAAMHSTRLQSMNAAMRQWGRFALSYLGRLYIAKQILASMSTTMRSSFARHMLSCRRWSA